MHRQPERKRGRINPGSEFPLPEIQSAKSAAHALVLSRLLSPLCADAQSHIDLLLRHYPSPAVALCCSEESLIEIGLPQPIAACVASLKPLLQEALFAELKSGPVLSDSQTVIHYLQSVIGYNPEESHVVLYLDNDLSLLALDHLDSGNQFAVSGKFRTIVRRCLDLHAKGIILSHNHPSGNEVPSRDDYRLTRDLKRMLADIGVELFDNLVMAKGKHFSILHGDQE